MQSNIPSGQRSLEKQSLEKRLLKIHFCRTGRYLVQLLFCLAVGLGIAIITALCRRYSTMGIESQQTATPTTMKVLQLGS